MSEDESEDDSEDDSDDEKEESESSEDSFDKDETLKSVENAASESPDEKSVDSTSPVSEEGVSHAGSDEMIQPVADEKAETEDDEITKNESLGCKRKIEVEEESLSKRSKNVDGVEEKIKEETGKGFYCDLNNSLETGYTSDLYSDLEESNEIYSDSYIASF